METELFNYRLDSFWTTFDIYFALFTLSIRLFRVDLIFIDQLSDYSLFKGLKIIMQMHNSLLGGCEDFRWDCNLLARDGRCHSNPYATLRECPIACGVRCGKFLII